MGSRYIRLRGLPWSVTPQEILKFLSDVNVVNDENGIKMVKSKFDGKSTGEAYVELASEEDEEAAFKHDKENLGHRYIEVFTATEEEVTENANRKAGGGARSSTVVKLRGLPYSADESVIEDFFGDLAIRSDREGIVLVKDRTGRASGEAYVQFESVAETEEALELNREKIGHRYIEIFPSSIGELKRALNSNRPGPYDRGNRGGGLRSGGGNDSFGGGRSGGMGRNNRSRDGWSNNDSGNRGGGGFNGGNFNGGGGFGNNFNNDGFNSGGGGFGGNNGGGFGGNSGFGGNNSGGFGGGNSGFGGNNGGGFGGNNGGGFGGNNSGGFGGGSGGGFGGNSGGGGFGGNNGGGNFNNFGNNRNFNDDNFGGGGGDGGSNFSNRNNMGGGGGGNFGNFGGNSGNNFGSGGGQDNSNDDYYCVHLRGMPYYCYEAEVKDFFEPLRPVNVKIIYNNKGLHSGTADAYFETQDDAQEAMSKDREQMGSRYIELFFDGKGKSGGGGGGGGGSGFRRI